MSFAPARGRDQHSRPTKLHFSHSLRSYPVTLPAAAAGAGNGASAGAGGEALGGSAANGKGAAPGASRRGPPNLQDPGHAVRAQPHLNRSGLYGRPYGTVAAVVDANGVHRKPPRSHDVGGAAAAGKSAAAPLPDAPVALDGSGSFGGSLGGATGRSLASSSGAGGGGLNGTQRVRAAAEADQRRRLRPPTHKPTVQTYGHVSQHLKHTLTPAQMRKRFDRYQQHMQDLQLLQQQMAQSQPQPQFADSDGKHADESVGGGAYGGQSAGAAPAAGAAAAAAAGASDFDVDESGLNRIARAKKALGVLRMGRVNPSFVSRYFASFKPHTRDDIPLPRTPNSLSATLPLAGTGAQRTSLFGLVPTTYTDIRVDPIGKVIGKDDGAVLKGAWRAHRATYEHYPLYGQSADPRNDPRNNTSSF